MFKFQLATRKKNFEKKKKDFEILFMHHHRHPSSIHEKGTEKRKKIGNIQGYEVDKAQFLKKLKYIYF